MKSVIFFFLPFLFLGSACSKEEPVLEEKREATAGPRNEPKNEPKTEPKTEPPRSEVSLRPPTPPPAEIPNSQMPPASLPTTSQAGQRPASSQSPSVPAVQNPIPSSVTPAQSTSPVSAPAPEPVVYHRGDVIRAVATNDIENLKRVLEAGGNVNEVIGSVNEAVTPLLAALANPSVSEEIIKLLLDRGASARQSYRGHQALTFAITRFGETHPLTQRIYQQISGRVH